MLLYDTDAIPRIKPKLTFWSEFLDLFTCWFRPCDFYIERPSTCTKCDMGYYRHECIKRFK